MQNIVMLLSNSFRPDPRVLKEAEFLQSNGFNLTILCWDRQADLLPEQVLPSGIRIIRIQSIPSSYGIGLPQLLRIPIFWLAIQHHLKKLTPNIIHCHDFDTLPAGLWFGLFHKIPIIYDAHEYYAKLVKSRLNGIVGWVLFNLIKLCEQLGAHFSSAVVTVDETLAAIYQKQNRNVVILGHYPEKRMAEYSNIIFTRPYLSLIYAGRLSIDRGILLYADMLRNLLDKGIPTRLLLAGTFTPESDKLILYDYTKDINNSIIYLGWVNYENMIQTYHTADIGLAILFPDPRYLAAVPVKLFEYMASGLPVIASNFPFIAEIVNDANCGFLVNPQTDLIEAIKTIELWWQNKAVPRTLGENGRKAVLSKYYWENHTNCLLELYRDLI